MTTALPPDPWKALGLERTADKSEVRTAYKKLVLKCHPDKVQDPTLKALKANEFQKVQQAYELLNDDAEKAKYEQKLRLAEQRAKAYPEVKSSPNMSVPRTKYEIRTTVEQTSRHKSSPSSGGKVYYTPHTRSHEEMPRTYALYEETDRQARRTASYEKPSRRDDERRDRDREDRRRRREEDELRLRDSREIGRDREREKVDKERDAKKADKKRVDKEREKERKRESEERKRESEEKVRRHKPYVEPYETYVEEVLYEEDEKYVTGRPEKKRSSSRKNDEPRERERERERERDKSSSRRAKSPHISADKHVDLFAHAASYIKTSHIGLSPPSTKAFWASQSHPEPAPTPPPVDPEEESIRYAAARAAGRRASNDPMRSREKLKYEAPDTPKGRPIPSLAKSYSTPPAVPESPPRISRSQTTPQESYRTIPVPSLNRTQTWAAGTTQYLDELVDWEDDGRDDRPRRSSRRARSPSAQATHRYKVDGIKTSKLEPQYAYASESPTSTRARYADDGRAARSPSHVHSMGIPVKQTKKYDWNDVSFSSYGGPAYYSNGTEAYA